MELKNFLQWNVVETKMSQKTDFDGHWVQTPVDGLVRESNVFI